MFRACHSLSPPFSKPEVKVVVGGGRVQRKPEVMVPFTSIDQESVYIYPLAILLLGGTGQVNAALWR